MQGASWNTGTSLPASYCLPDQVVYNEYIADRNHIHMNSTHWCGRTRARLPHSRDRLEVCLHEGTLEARTPGQAEGLRRGLRLREQEGLSRGSW